MSAPSEARPSQRALGGRLHPAAIGVWTMGSAAPVAFLVVAGGANRAIAGAAVTVAAVSALVRYLRFEWHVEGATLVITQGLLQRRRRVIPFERIQAVESVRKLRHRLFGVVELRVETVGAQATEGRLEALSPADARQLRSVLLQRDPGLPAAAADEARPAAEDVLVRLGPGRLILAGMTGGRVGVAAALFGFGQDLVGERVARWLPALDPSRHPRGTAAVVVAILAGAFLLSVVATLLTYWNFTLTTDGPDLRVRRGLLEQRSDTLPLRRVQALRIEANLLRRWLGLAAVKVDVAGRVGGEEGQVSAVVLPLGTAADARRLVADVLSAHPGLGDARLSRMPRAARDRRLVRAGVATLAVTVAAVAVTGLPGVLGVLVAVPAAAAALASYRSLGRGECAGVLIARSGWIVQRTSYVPRQRLQSLALRQSPFQRSRGLATLLLQIARGPGGAGDPALIDMDAAEARRLLAELLVPAEVVASAPPGDSP